MPLRRYIFNTLTVVSLLLPWLAISMATPALADDELVKLRHELALNYFEPLYHVKLAKYLYDKGDRHTAFQVLTQARNHWFSRDYPHTKHRFRDFEKAYWLVFKGIDTSEEASTAIHARLKKTPNDFDTLYAAGKYYSVVADFDRAETYFRQAVKLKPTDVGLVDFLASVMVKGDKSQDDVSQLLKGIAKDHPKSEIALLDKFRELDDRDQASNTAMLKKAVKDFPNCGYFHYFLASNLTKAAKFDEAAKHFELAKKTYPTADLHTQRSYFYSVHRKDNPRALECFLDAYFEDLEIYTENTGRWFKKLRNEIALKRLDDADPKKASYVRLLEDANPDLVTETIKRMDKAWRPEYFPALVKVMSHDSPVVRWNATTCIRDHAAAAFVKKHEAMLTDKDLRRRGLSFYIFLRYKGANGIKVLEPALQHKSHLIRYDALSALQQEGGLAGGLRIRRHAKVEQQPYLANWVKRYLLSRH